MAKTEAFFLVVDLFINMFGCLNINVIANRILEKCAKNPYSRFKHMFNAEHYKILYSRMSNPMISWSRGLNTILYFAQQNASSIRFSHTLFIANETNRIFSPITLLVEIHLIRVSEIKKKRANSDQN